MKTATDSVNASTYSLAKARTQLELKLMAAIMAHPSLQTGEREGTDRVERLPS